MKSHASMNRIYRLVWNAALSLWVAVAENAKGRSKGGSARSSVDCSSVHQGDGGHGGDGGGSGHQGFALNTACRAALVLMVSSAFLTSQAYAASAADASVVGGAGSVATSGLTTTITQASQRLAIDWTSLSTRANEALVFNQPNAAAIALNRITGTSPSELLGSLTANGQVFILNPNGVLFGAGSQVNVGGIVASTLSMSNADFMAGNHVFTNSGGTGSVINQGTMTAAQGGYLALLAPEVRNEGVMTASLGTALLAAGNKVTLNLDNGSLLGYSIDQGAINALAENKQLIKADGGQVLLSAKAMDSLTTATVNNTGIIEAKTLQNKAGRIMLMGDMAYGTVNIGGTLDASAPNGGDGGFIETSAAQFKILPGAKVTTQAPQGKTGTWLLDPASVTIAGGTGTTDANTIYEDYLEAATTNVVIEADNAITASGTFGNSDVQMQSGLDLTIRTIGTSGTGIDLTGSTHGAGLEFKTSGGGSVLMSTAAASQAIKTSQVTVADGGNINLNSAGLLDITNTSLQTAGGAISLTGAGTSLGDGVKISTAVVNAGTGALNITGSSTTGAYGVNIENASGASQLTGGAVSITGSTTGGAYGVRVDRSTITASNGLTLDSATGGSRMALQGATLTASGGNMLLKSKGISNEGPDFFQSLLIEDVAGARSNIRNTGSGNITVDAELTNHTNVSLAGTPSALLVRNSDITTSAGTLSLTGKTGTGSDVDGTTGVMLASGAKVTGAGNVSITGSAGARSFSGSTGVNIATGAQVSSSGGNVAVSGTSNNPSSFSGVGVRLTGKVAAAAGTVTITGDAVTAGDPLGPGGQSAVNPRDGDLYSGNPSGISISTGADISAGVGVAINGTIRSSSVAFNPIGISMDGGTITSPGSIVMTGTIDAPSAAGGKGLDLRYGTVSATGAGTISLIGSGVPAPAPSSAYDLNIVGTTVRSAGGQINLTADRINIENTVNAGAGRVVITPTATNREISLGGSDEGYRLNLSAREINNITAGELQIGSVTNTGGITIGSTGGAIAPAPSPLPYINLVTAADISQMAGSSLQVYRLNAQGRSVSLGNSGNAFDAISGSASSGSFAVTSGKAGPMAVGSISATGNVTLNAANGAITDGNGAANNITAASLNASSSDGISLDTEVSGLSTLTTTGSAGDIRIATSRAMELNNSSQFLISTAAGSAQNISLATSSATGITNVNMFAGSADNVTVIASNASADITQNTALTLGSGSLTLDAGRDIVLSGAISKTAGAASALTLDAGRDIKFNSNIQSTNNALGLTADADRNVDGPGTLNLNGGALDITAGGSLYLGQILAGNVKLETTTGDLTMDSGVDWRGTSFDLKAGGNIRGTDIASSPVILVKQSGGTGNLSAQAGTAGAGSLNLLASGIFNTMALEAEGNISLTDSVTATSLSLDALGTISAPGAVNVGTFDLKSGTWSQLGGSLPAFSATDFRITGGSFLRALGGDGNVNPYIISDVYGLQGAASASMLNSYMLANNIDASGTANWNAGAGFKPIGNMTAGYSGAFNGNNNTISNLTINRPTEDYVGLFGRGGLGGSIQNVGLINVNLRGRGLVGGLVGFSQSYLSKTYVQGSVNGLYIVGGLVGQNQNLIVESYSTGSVTSDQDDVGGLVGTNQRFIYRSYSTSSVNVGTYGQAGGLVGRHDANGSDISNSYATGNVTGGVSAGGLVGTQSIGTVIRNSYATGSVTGGGLDPDMVGALVGESDGRITSSFWLAGATRGIGTFYDQTKVNALTRGLSSAEFKSSATFTNAGWQASNVGGDSNVWRIYEGNTGPLLRILLTGLTLADSTVTYNGGTQQGTTTTDSRVQGSSASGRNAGSYASGYYSDQEGVDIIGGSLTVSKANLVLTSSDVSKTYDGGTTAAGTAVAAASTTLLGGDTATGGSFAFADKNVGTANKTVNASGVTVNDGNGGNNYNISYIDNTTSTINKADLTVTASAVTKTYDGTTSATGAGTVAALAGAAAGELVDSAGTQAFLDKNAGVANKKVRASGVTIKDASNADVTGNYNIAYIDNTLSTINKASLTLAAASDSKTYDGTTASAAAVSNSGLVGGDTVTAVQSFGSKNVMGAGGSTLSVDAGYTIADGNNGGNYNVTTTTAAGTISKASLTLAAVTDTKTYDGTRNSSLAVSAIGLFSSDSVTADQSFGSKNVLGAGNSTLSVDAGYTVADGNSGGNYNVTTTTAAGTINKASLTLAAVTDTKTYDATAASTATVSKIGLAGGDTVTAVQSFGSKNVLGAGSSTLSVDSGYTVNDGNSGNNYVVTSSGTAAGTINKASLTLAAVTDTRTYDGTVASSGVVGNSGLVGGDTVTAVQAFGSKNVMGSNGSTLSVASYNLNDGNGGGNYNVTTTTAAGTINKATLNLTATPDDKVYDGTTLATASYSDNRIAGDVLSYAATASFASKNVGNGIAVTVGGITTSGADAGNYTVGSTTVGNTADITPKTLTVTANDDSKMTGTPYSGGNGVSYSGIVAGETVAGVLTGSLAYSGNSQGANTPGEYDITPGGLVANSNYRLNFVDGTLNLESPPAAVSVQLKLLQDIPTLSSFSKDSALFKVQLATDIASALGISAGRVSVVSLGGDGGGGSSGGGAAGGGDSGGSGGSNSPNAAGNALNAAAAE